MCCVGSNSPVTSSRGVDLRYFRPHYQLRPCSLLEDLVNLFRPTNERRGNGRVYEAGTYRVQFSTEYDFFNRHSNKQVQEELSYKFVESILANFPHRAYCHIYFTSEFRNPKTQEFDTSIPYRLIKDETSQITLVANKTWQNHLDDVQQMKEQGYSRIILDTRFGLYGNKVITKKGKWVLSEDVLNMF